jgi:hypothetical protein
MSKLITNEMLEKMTHEEQKIIADLNKECFIKKLSKNLTEGTLVYTDFMTIMSAVVPCDDVKRFTEEGWEKKFWYLLLPNYYCCGCWNFADCECKCECHSKDGWWQCEECETEYNGKIPFVNINDFKYCLDCCE